MFSVGVCNLQKVSPFLRHRSRQSLMVRRLSDRKSLSTLEENACCKDSRPARRVLALQRQREKGDATEIKRRGRIFSWYKPRIDVPLVHQVVDTLLEFVLCFFLCSLLIHLLPPCLVGHAQTNCS